jgi:FkbM family methyltransferase
MRYPTAAVRSASRISVLVRRVVVPLAKALPASAGAFMLRALNKALKLSKRSFLASTGFGAIMLCDPRDSIQVKLLNFGVWEPDVSAVIAEILRPGDVFADIGANVGYDTLLASAVVGASGRVIAIEANPATFDLLLSNIELNSCLNIRCVNVAASDQVGTLPIYAPVEFETGMVSTLFERGGEMLGEIPAQTLDDILDDDELRRLRLIKIDIEGGELRVLRRLLQTIDVFPGTVAIIVELSVDAPGAAEVFGAMLDAGFSADAIANEFSTEWYLKWRRPHQMRAIDRLPDRQTDILFTRTGEAGRTDRRRPRVAPEKSACTTQEQLEGTKP